MSNTRIFLFPSNADSLSFTSSILLLPVLLPVSVIFFRTLRYVALHMSSSSIVYEEGLGLLPPAADSRLLIESVPLLVILATVLLLLLLVFKILI